MHELNGLDSSNPFEQVSYDVLVRSYFTLNVAQVQRLTGRVKRNGLSFLEPKLVLGGDENHGLRRLVGKRELDLLVVRVEDFQLGTEKGHVIQVVLCVLGVVEFFELHQR